MRNLIITYLVDWEEDDENNENNQHFTFATVEEYKAMSDEELLSLYRQAVLTYCEH